MTPPTPGPYELYSEGRTIVVGDVATHTDLAEFFYCDEHTVSTTRDEALANASRFMAASALLAACKALNRSWSDTFPEGPEWRDPKGNLSIASEHINIWKHIRAAIREAEGQS